MKKVFLIIGCMLVTACVENLIHISVFPSGEYSIKYNSIGDINDLNNNDFLHPQTSNSIEWSSTLNQRSDSLKPDNLNWEKETISKELINGTISFTKNGSLIYQVDIQKNEYFFWDQYSFKSTINSLDIDKKYPSIVQFLDIDADSLSWIVPAKEYIIKNSLEEYEKSVDLNTVFSEKINNQIDTYFDYAKQRKLLEKFNKDSSLILKDALKPIASTLPKQFFKEITVFIDTYEEDFKKNTALMNDYFQFNIVLPGLIQKNNALSISDGLLVWSLDFDDIATDEFKMYANSVRMNKFRVQLLLLLLVAGFLGILWNQKLNKK